MQMLFGIKSFFFKEWKMFKNFKITLCESWRDHNKSTKKNFLKRDEVILFTRIEVFFFLKIKKFSCVIFCRLIAQRIQMKFFQYFDGHFEDGGETTSIQLTVFKVTAFLPHFCAVIIKFQTEKCPLPWSPFCYSNVK